jgi:hypothetical protein
MRSRRRSPGMAGPRFSIPTRALHVETGRIRSVIGLTLGGGHPPASGGRDRKSLGGKHRGAAWSVRLRLLS